MTKFIDLNNMKEGYSESYGYRDKALSLGESTVFTATQIAEGMEYLALSGMKAKEAGRHFADTLAFAQANANTNVEQMGEAMKYAVQRSNPNEMGWTIEEMTAAMMKLADNDLTGSIAGQVFSASVGRLSKPTKAMRKTMDELGISFFDANGVIKPLPEIVEHLEDKFKGLKMKQKAVALTTLFGTDAYKHWAILLESGSDVLNKYTKSLEMLD